MRPRHVAGIVAAALVAAVAATATPARVTDASAQGCNNRLKELKTLSDSQRQLVNLHAKNTTVAAINALAPAAPDAEDPVERFRPPGLARDSTDHAVQA